MTVKFTAAKRQRHQRINKEKEDLNMEGILNPVN